MTSQYFQFSKSINAENSIASAWLKLSVVSLVLAGIFSIVLVLSRTPVIKEMIPFSNFFYVALVVHVDLSVLIWFVSFAGVLWSFTTDSKNNVLNKIAIGLAITGTLAISIAPFIGVGNPLMNNYIPILDHPIFITGLSIFGLGMLLQILLRITSSPPNFSNPSPSDALDTGIYISAWIALLALISLVASYVGIPSSYESTAFYEVLFWGSGHILQYTHTLLLLVAWLWIGKAAGISIDFSPKIAQWLFLLAAFPLVVTPFIYLQYDVVSLEHRTAFTDLMKYGGLASIPLGFVVVFSIIKSPTFHANKLPVKAALLSSITLFAAGGIIGFMIDGMNVVVPAHYHGSIVGVTLAFMGLAYHLLPYLGFSRPMSKMACWQPYIYGGGQLMHIIGLVWSGGYGVQRKTFGAEDVLEHLPQIASMGLMGAGGAISIIGGTLFIIVMIKAFLRKETA